MITTMHLLRCYQPTRILASGDFLCNVIFKGRGIDNLCCQIDSVDIVTSLKPCERRWLFACCGFYSITELNQCCYHVAFYPHFNAITTLLGISFHHHKGLPGVAVSWMDYIFFTIYALSLTRLRLAFGSDYGCKPLLRLIPQ